MSQLKFIVPFALLIFTSCGNQMKNNNAADKKDVQKITLSKADLKDKIKGGWAGQTIGVTFGGVTEFKFQGTFIKDYHPIPWYDGYMAETMKGWPDLYDDVYMDLTFVDMIEKHGVDAPVDVFANAFANAGYNLWHANQAARHNILNGIKAPESGHWHNNPHADDIDYQIEADYSGLMNPGMPNSASIINDKIGHIMNYGDGWYGGVFVGALYSLAFTNNNIKDIITGALKTIPAESTFHQCIADVIAWHEQYPNDWHQTWSEIERKWAEDKGCPDGVYQPLNIDARVNSAYVVLGLLYGEEDYSKTIEISTRAGQDSDCNPSTAAGVLGTMIGYDNIPAYWKLGLTEIEDMNFQHIDMSLNKVYEISNKHALMMIEKNGGKINDNDVTIVVQNPEAVRLEQSFEGIYPVGKSTKIANDQNTITFTFEGTGFTLRGRSKKHRHDVADYTFEADVYIDGVKTESVKWPTSFLERRLDLAWNYLLEKKSHEVKIVINNPNPDYGVESWQYLVYSDEPRNTDYDHNTIINN